MKSNNSCFRFVINRLGWCLTLGSFPVWCAVFIVPFLPIPPAQRAAWGAGFVIAGELMFWAGLAILGPSVAAKFRAPKVNTGKSFQGKKVAVIGATGGLGSAIVAALVREGARVIPMARNLDKLNEIANSNQLFKNNASIDNSQYIEKPVEIDICRTESIANACEMAQNLDALIVATGCDVRKALESHSEQDVRNQLETNLAGPILITKSFLSAIAPGGVLAHLGGFGDGRLALPYYSADVASRAGLAAFCASVNRELRIQKRDIVIGYICPSPADTESERPYLKVWRQMGTKPVSPAKVADFVLASILARKELAIMGCSVWFISKLDGLWARAADFLGLKRVAKILDGAFGSR